MVDRFMQRPHATGEAYLAVVGASQVLHSLPLYLIGTAIFAPFLGAAALPVIVILLQLVDALTNGPKRRKGRCPKCGAGLATAVILPASSYPEGQSGRQCSSCGYQAVNGRPRWADWAGF